MKYCLNYPSVEHTAREPLLHWRTERKIHRQLQLLGPLQMSVGAIPTQPPLWAARSPNNPHLLPSLFLGIGTRVEEKQGNSTDMF